MSTSLASVCKAMAAECNLIGHTREPRLNLLPIRELADARLYLKRYALRVIHDNNTAMSSKFNVLYVGAGIVNFGGAAGPWNHSKRLEQ